MPTKTIPIAFDPESLPAWAQRYPEVIELCKRDLAYRVRVCEADSASMRKLLRRLASGTDVR